MATQAQRRAALTSGDAKRAKSYFSPAVSKRRNEENNRRWSAAKSRAHLALSRLYPDDYRALVEVARADVDAERGPLPGDD